MPKTTGWRKVATTWGWPTDPQIYGPLEVDGAPILEAVEVHRERTRAYVTATTL